MDFSSPETETQAKAQTLQSKGRQSREQRNAVFGCCDCWCMECFSARGFGLWFGIWKVGV